MTMVPCPYEGVGCTFHDKRRHLKDHLEESMEDHLSKTWSELLKTTQRLDGLEGVLLDKEYMEHRNNEEISNLRQSEKKLELENKRLQDDITGLQDDIKGLRDDMVVLRQVYMKNKDEVDVLRRIVQTKESNYHEKPLPSKPSKNYTGRKMDDSKSPAHRIFSAAVGLRTGAGKIWRKHANKHDDSDESGDEHEIEWSRGRYQFSEGEDALDFEDSCESS